MAFTSFKNCTRKQYEDEIYGQDYQHKIKITFDGVEKEISLGIDSEEIESNDNISSDTIDLTKVINKIKEEINEKN